MSNASGRPSSPRPSARIDGQSLGIRRTALREFKGELQGQGLRIALVASRFNEQVTSRLVAGAREGLLGHGVREEDLVLVWVPGSFELPLVAKTLAASGRYQAVICLGAVIKGETAHFEYIASEAARGIAAVSRETGVPVIFGVLTTYNLDQALARSGGEQGNRGYNAALTALQMASLLRRLKEKG